MFTNELYNYNNYQLDGYMIEKVSWVTAFRVELGEEKFRCRQRTG